MLGQTILHYDVLDKIGSGGMGDVYKAQDKRLNRFVAIKVLPYGKSGDQERRRRFIQEAQTASALSHPNIITIHDIFQEGDAHYIVMEYVAGRTLLEMIPKTGLRVGQVLQYATQMADAMSAAHSAGIIHRDFKPANVMITNSGLVKILDFGLAKMVQPLWMSSAASATVSAPGGKANDDATMTAGPMTAEGSILGTVNYMSPEQAEGKRVDDRSDIFSFGAVLYEMVTGRRAFQGDSDISTLSAVLRDDAKPISTLVPDVPHELEDLIKVCLHKDPAERWQSMKEVEMGLSGLKRRSDAGVLTPRQSSPASVAPAALSSPPVASAAARNAAAPNTAAPSTPAVASVAKRPSRNVIVLCAAALALVLVVSMAGWWRWSHRGPIAQVAQVATSAPVVAPPATSAETPAQTATPAASQPETSASATTAPPKASTPAQQAPVKPIPAPAPPPGETAPSGTAALAQPPPVPPVAREAPKPKPEAARAPTQTITLSVGDGLPFRIALAENVPADAQGGRDLTFRSLDDVFDKTGETIVIAKGATITGSIVGERGKKFLGIGSKMTFQLDSAQTLEGQKLKLRASAGKKADGPTTRALDTGKYAKPKDVAAAAGTDYVAYIDGDQTLSVHK